MITFAAMNLLGDPLFNILGPVAGDVDNPESLKLIEEAKEQYYLDKSLPERYVRWAGDFVTGDFGVRFTSLYYVCFMECVPSSALNYGKFEIWQRRSRTVQEKPTTNP